MSWSMVADGDAHCEIRWEIAHCLFASADNISELRISDIHSWRDTVFEVVAYVIDLFYSTYWIPRNFLLSYFAKLKYKLL